MKKIIQYVVIAFSFLLPLPVYAFTQSNTTVYVECGVLHNVVFQSMGGSDIQTIRVSDGTCVTRPNNPIRDNYNFINWYKEPSYITVYDFSAPVIEDITLYAKWELQQNTSNQGGGSGGGGSHIDNPQPIPIPKPEPEPEPIIPTPPDKPEEEPEQEPEDNPNNKPDKDNPTVEKSDEEENHSNNDNLDDELVKSQPSKKPTIPEKSNTEKLDFIRPIPKPIKDIKKPVKEEKDTEKEQKDNNHQSDQSSDDRDKTFWHIKHWREDGIIVQYFSILIFLIVLIVFHIIQKRRKRCERK